MQRSSIFLNRGRKKIPLLQNVTEQECDRFIDHAADGLQENGRSFNLFLDGIMVYGPEERPLYSITVEATETCN